MENFHHSYCFVQPYTEEEKQKLQKANTRKLLKELRSYDNKGQSFDYCSVSNCQEECNRNEKENKKFLKAILATRPHVMNKQESKAYRKARKKQGK